MDACAEGGGGGVRGKVLRKIFEIGRSQTPFSVFPGLDPDFITHQRNDHLFPIALFTVNFSHLHYNVFERGCEAISG